jgi:hypothetical protein
MRALRAILLFALVPFFASSVATAQASSAAKPNIEPSSSIPTGIISIFAGNQEGYSGDGGPATSADMNYPRSVAIDSSGNLYIADSSNNVIRLVTRSTGVISTFAGIGGASGYSGDGQIATEAKLNSPRGVALDSSGNLYIADTANCVIRRVDAISNIIATVVGKMTYYPDCAESGDGGPATAATLNAPSGIAFDSAGNLYIADYGNSMVRRVDARTQTISVFAGSCNSLFFCEGGFGGDGGPATAASLNDPSAVAFDSSGNLYIADGGNDIVRRVDAQSGVITTVAGNCSRGECQWGYTPDGGLATEANLSSPQGVAVDPFGNLIFSDSGNGLVREVNAGTGVLTTIAGDLNTANLTGNGGPATAASLREPAQLAFDASGNLYIADILGEVVDQVTGSTTPAALAPVVTPPGGAFTASESVTISDASPNSTIYYTLDGSLPSTSSDVYSSPIGISKSATVTAFATATGLVNSPAAVQVYTYVPATPLPVFTPPAGTYKWPLVITVSDKVPAAIYFTIDGSTPTTNSFEGTSIAINPVPTTTVKAFAQGVQGSYSPSAVVTAVYNLALPPAGTPTFSPPAGTYTSIQNVTISTSAYKPTIYYTLDGTTPTTQSAVYSGPVSIAKTTTVKALATAPASGLANSAVASATYTLNLPVLAAPTFVPKAGTYTGTQSVTIADATTGAALYYTLDGTTPTAQSTVYSGPVSIAANSTIKAIATKTGYGNSQPATAAYVISLPAPTISPKSATYTAIQSVSIEDAVAAAGIYYTLDGTTPTANSSLYSGPITIAKTTTVKAIAVETGYGNSAVVTAAYTINLPVLPAPTFSPKAATYTAIQNVSISDTGSGATIYYTLDGTTPTVKSAVYSSPISIAKTTTVKAIAAQSGYANSAVATAAYTIDLPVLPAPTFSPAAGTYHGVPDVTMADANQSAQIFYTFDGTTPTVSSTPFSGPIDITKTTTLKAIAAAAGYANSPVSSATYTIVLAPLVGIAAATNVTSNSATLNGLVNPDNQGTTYWFVYGPSLTSLSFKTTTQSIPAGSNIVAVSVPVTKLAGNTTYFFQIVAQSAGGSNSSEVLSFTTK